MQMADQTNPRKIVQVGNNLGVTLPNAKVDDWGIEKGQRYVLEETENGFEAERVEWRVAGDE